MLHLEPVVITGIGLVASVGQGREAVWQAVREGRSGVRRLEGLPCIPDGLMIGAPVEMAVDYPGQLKVTAMALRAAGEALRDAQVNLCEIERDRCACAIAGHVSDTRGIDLALGRLDPAVAAEEAPWYEQWLPNTACATVGQHYGLWGPRLSHSAACASGTIQILTAVRALQDDQCDLALAGSSEAIHPLFAAGFRRMQVLAEHEDPTQACKPFDRDRQGFVMGEGAGMLVLERLDHALARNAPIYAEICGGKMLSEAHHVTGIDASSQPLSKLIELTLRSAGLAPDEIGYINAHGTGTLQNDVAETRGIRAAFGSAAAHTRVSSVKSILGHLVNAAGSVELALTALALRDGFAPPTINLRNPDPECDLDCIPLVGRETPLDCALKLSVAFGGHLAAVALRRWPDAQTARAAQPLRRAA